LSPEHPQAVITLSADRLKGFPSSVIKELVILLYEVQYESAVEDLKDA